MIPDLLEQKQKNTEAMVDAYSDLFAKEREHDWEGVRRARERIRRLYDENKQIHEQYQGGYL